MNPNTSTKSPKALGRTMNSARVAHRPKHGTRKKVSIKGKDLGAERSKAGADEFSLRFDEAVDQLKGMVQVATDFVQRRPLIVMATAAAAGLFGAWALSHNKKSVK